MHKAAFYLVPSGRVGDYLAFIRSPALPPRRQGLSPKSARAVALLFALDVLITLVFIGLLYLAEKAGHTLPEIPWDMDLGSIFLVGIVVAPVLEELLFRVWLTGQRGAILAIASPVSLFAAIAALLAFAPDGGALARLGIVGLVLAWVVGTVFLAIRRKSQGVAGAYVRVFPWLFWASCVLFAAAHILNLEGGFQPLLVLLVVPQFVGGTILAFVRLHYGMWANTSMHASFNALLLTAAWAMGDLN